MTPKRASTEVKLQTLLTEAAPVKTGETPLEVLDSGDVPLELEDPGETALEGVAKGVGTTMIELATGTTVVCGTGVFNDSGQFD